MSKRRVAYYYDNDVGLFSYGLGHFMKPHRMKMTHELISAYGMLNQMQVLRPRRASPHNMTAFHSDEYVHFLSRVTPETARELTGQGQRFLMGYDNPAFEGVFEFCSISAGGSIDAARRISSGNADISINWAGGLHHAKKSEAAGFCYINDIVLSILELLRTYPRVLYIDIDCHHGDGVEEAFYTTNRVLTCSFHKFGEYFPGTGHLDDCGVGKGNGYSVNVPLRDGLTDEAFKNVFEPVIQRILEWYRPAAVVLQCGADSVSGDKLGCFNLTMEGHANCVQYLRKSGIPLILLGGGGYTIKNVARLWAYETACALSIENDIDRNLPWNSYFEWFGPRYRLEVVKSNMDDKNPKDGYLDEVKAQVLKNLETLPFAPSVQMQDVPRQSLGEHLGFASHREDEIEADGLDERLGHAFRTVYNMQRRESSPSDSDEPDSPDSDNDDASLSRGQHLYPHRRGTRMSILPPALAAQAHGKKGPGTMEAQPRAPRRFFQTNALWDASLNAVMMHGHLSSRRVRLGDAMEGGGMDVDMDDESLREGYWREGDMSISVEI